MAPIRMNSHEFLKLKERERERPGLGNENPGKEGAEENSSRAIFQLDC